MNPSYRFVSDRMLLLFTNVNSRRGCTQQQRGYRSGTQMCPIAIKAWLLGFTDGAREGDTNTGFGLYTMALQV
jgi:hypothetical protein